MVVVHAEGLIIILLLTKDEARVAPILSKLTLKVGRQSNETTKIGIIGTKNNLIGTISFLIHILTPGNLGLKGNQTKLLVLTKVNRLQIADVVSLGNEVKLEFEHHWNFVLVDKAVDIMQEH
jgi:hypothetical protein